MDKVRRIAKVIVGVVLLFVGILLLVLPGPGVVGIVAGLAILSTEFVWAARLLHHAKEKARQAANAVTGNGAK